MVSVSVTSSVDTRCWPISPGAPQSARVSGEAAEWATSVNVRDQSIHALVNLAR